MQKNNSNAVRYITFTGLMSALAVVIYYFLPEIPIIPGVPHLKMDFSDVPVVLGGLFINPFSAVIICLIKNLIHLAKTSTFGVGEAANFIVGATIALAFCLPYKFMSKSTNQTLSAVISTVFSAAMTVVLGFAANYGLVYLYLNFLGKYSAKVHITFSLSSVPMNLLKAPVVLIVSYIIYKALQKPLKKII